MQIGFNSGAQTHIVYGRNERRWRTITSIRRELGLPVDDGPTPVREALSGPNATTGNVSACLERIDCRSNSLT
jgi:hypothetical protein